MAKKNLSVRKSATPKFTVGIDLGGTKVATALVDEAGNIHKETRRPTVPADYIRDLTPSPSQVKNHTQYVMSAIAEAVLEVTQGVKLSQVRAVGLASAGPLNTLKGTLNHPANFPGWKIVPIVKLLKAELIAHGLNRPLYFQNDAIAAALGEGWIGKTANCSTYAMITLGTGIGTGVILNGQPAQSRGMGAEWGHLIVQAPQIQDAQNELYERTVEGLASGTGLFQRACARGFQGANTAELATAARKGDAVALRTFIEASEALAALFFNLSLGFHPEKFVVTGGMLPIRDLFLPQAISLYRDLIKKQGPEFLAPILISKLGNSAGVIGAARLSHLKSENKF
jgi:glucokinase